MLSETTVVSSVKLCTINLSILFGQQKKCVSSLVSARIFFDLVESRRLFHPI